MQETERKHLEESFCESGTVISPTLHSVKVILRLRMATKKTTASRWIFSALASGFLRLACSRLTSIPPCESGSSSSFHHNMKPGTSASRQRNMQRGSTSEVHSYSPSCLAALC